jgi:hypothetical protein
MDIPATLLIAYTVFIANATAIAMPRANILPDIAVGAAQYAARIMIRRIHLRCGNGRVIQSMTFRHRGAHEGFQSRVRCRRYEGEHLVLYYNDRRRYSETAITVRAADSDPAIGLCPISYAS